MKIGDFLPDIVNQNAQLTQSNQWLNKLYDMGFTGFLKSKYGPNVNSAAQYYGIEQLYFDWLRQAYSYRRMFIQDLYLLAFDCSEIRTPLLHLKKEIFRKGFDEWHPKFAVRCETCGINFRSREEAKGHEGHKLVEPDISQIQRFDDKWRNRCNIFGQSLESVLLELCDDLNIVDDLWLHLNKQYTRVNNKTYSKVVEIRRIHPALMEFDLDKNGLPKNSHWLCRFHRDIVQTKPGTCSVPGCGAELEPAMYVYNHRGGRVYLFEDEIIHESKFSPSTTYGYSPILTIMQKVLTISGMDRFLYRYFFERKTPTQMILTNTDDPQSLELERSRMESKMMEDPTYTPWIAVSNRTGRGRTDVVRLFHTLHEMDYLRIREEIRDRVAGIYGVPQMYYNVMEGIGGISGQSVTGDTPLYVRYDKKYIDILPISCLQGQKVNGEKWRSRDLKRLEVWTKSGWSEVKGFYKHMNLAPIKVVEAYDGVVKLTGDHSIMCDGEVWKSTNSLQPGDIIVTNIFNEKQSFDNISKDFAWALGFWCAEGSSNQNFASTGVSNINRKLLDKWSKIISDQYFVDCKVNFDLEDGGKLCGAEVQGKWINQDILRRCTIGKNIAYGQNLPRKLYSFKKVPIEVLNGTNEVKESFLEGYWEGDGSGSIEQGGFKTIDSVLAAGLLYLIRSLGNIVKISFNLGTINQNNDVYRGSILKNFDKYYINKKSNEIKKITDWTKEKELVFDIETEDHTFVTALGDFVLHNTQQLKMMSNVVASDQRMYNERIIPTILKALGVTDWEIILRAPEEKVEGQTLQLAQQKVSVATQMRQMGFDIKLKPGATDIETLDFTFEGKASNIAEQFGMPGAGGMPVGTTPGMPVGGNGESPFPEEAETPKTEGEEFTPREHRLENEPYNEPSPKESEEEEDDSFEEGVYNH
jgi:hypothetical protein